MEVEIGDEVVSFDESVREMVFRRVIEKCVSAGPAIECAVGERRAVLGRHQGVYSYTYDPERPMKLGRYALGHVPATSLSSVLIPTDAPDFGQPYRLWRPPPERTIQFVTHNQHQRNLVSTRTRTCVLTLPEHTTTDLMWLFGCFIGDGDLVLTMGKSAPRFGKLGFSVPTYDRAYEKLRSVMSTITERQPTVRKDQIHSCWNDMDLVEFFTQNGFCTGVRNKRVPPWMYTLPRPQRVAFLAGCLDSDGTTRNRHASIKAANKKLLKDIAVLCSGLGRTSRIHTEYEEEHRRMVHGRMCTARESHRLEFLVENLEPELTQHLSAGFQERLLNMPPRQHTLRKQVGRSKIVLPECVDVIKVDCQPYPTTDLVELSLDQGTNYVADGFIVQAL